MMTLSSTSKLLQSHLNRTMAMSSLTSLSSDEKRTFLDSFDTVITDCDGVIWHGRTPVPGAKDVLNGLKNKGKRRFYFTNNSTQTRTQFVNKLESMGFSASEDEIISTAWLTAVYLKLKNFNKKVYVIGAKSIQEELGKVGIESFGVGADNYVPKMNNSVPLTVSDMDIDLVPDVGAVVVGYDVFFSFPKILKACAYLNQPGSLFIATNTDEKFPHKKHIAIPGCGAFVAAVETCADRKAEIMGKPSTFAIDVALKNEMIPGRTLMIGDRCNTDIYFGNRSGMQTLLVETGVHKFANLKQFQEENKSYLLPSYYTSTIADLLDILKL